MEFLSSVHLPPKNTPESIRNRNSPKGWLNVSLMEETNLLLTQGRIGVTSGFLKKLLDVECLFVYGESLVRIDDIDRDF
ncbi:hypothetical protein RB195_008864 [Necator americanus]|uniref:Uncharacterized protein n=1 Tax=Necator americanus TaxID=51031 RepID=A0ABR1CQN8_NECAM